MEYIQYSKKIIILRFFFKVINKFPRWAMKMNEILKAITAFVDAKRR